MDNLTSVTVSTLSDNDLFTIDLGDLDDRDWLSDYAVPKDAANHGSRTRCGKIIRRFNHRTNEPPEKYIRRIYRLLSEECAPAQKHVRFLNGGRLPPTRDGKSVAYEFEVGTWDGEFRQEFALSVPVVRR